jgi:hypothetical protein
MVHHVHNQHNKTTTPSSRYLNNSHPCSNFNIHQIMLAINKTSILDSFRSLIESNSTISIKAEHFSNSTSNDDAQYEVFPMEGRTLSSVALMPFAAPSQSSTSSSASKLTYDVCLFTPNVTKANATLYMGTAMMTNPTRPEKYAASIDDDKPQTVQPNPPTHLSSLRQMWSTMVADAAATNNTTNAVPHSRSAYA